MSAVAELVAGIEAKIAEIERQADALRKARDVLLDIGDAAASHDLPANTAAAAAAPIKKPAFTADWPPKSLRGRIADVLVKQPGLTAEQIIEAITARNGGGRRPRKDHVENALMAGVAQEVFVRSGGEPGKVFTTETYSLAAG